MVHAIAFGRVGVPFGAWAKRVKSDGFDDSGLAFFPFYFKSAVKLHSPVTNVMGAAGILINATV